MNKRQLTAIVINRRLQLELHCCSLNSLEPSGDVCSHSTRLCHYHAISAMLMPPTKKSGGRQAMLHFFHSFSSLL